MTKTNKQINKESVVGDVESTPAVVSYRVGRLEATQREGFEIINKKLDGIVAGFVTEKEMSEAKLDGQKEHKLLWQAVEDIKKSARWWLTFIVGLIGAAAGLILAVKK
jgi:hypothetical protein